MFCPSSSAEFATERNSTFRSRRSSPAASSLLRARLRSWTAASRGHHACASSANKTASSPSPKRWFPAPTSLSLYLSRCLNLPQGSRRRRLQRRRRLRWRLRLRLRLRLELRLVARARRQDHSSASSWCIPSPSKNRRRGAQRLAQTARCNQDQKLGVPQRIISAAEGIAQPWQIGETRQAHQRARFLVVQQTADQRRFVFLDAHRLAQRAVREHRNPIDVRSRQRSNFEF